MNRFYFKNKNNPQKRCFEVYGIDIFTGIRYSIALCGSRSAAQKALGEYLMRIQPYDYYVGTTHKYEGLLFIEQITVEHYLAHRHKELTQRFRLRMSYSIFAEESKIASNSLSSQTTEAVKDKDY